jgi:uncharacterized protein
LPQRQGQQARFHLTTNGTVAGRQAWAIMLADDLELAVSFDGTPANHNHHRRDVAGIGSAENVLACLRQLREAGKSYRVVMVVRPDNLAEVPAGLRFLREFGARQIELALDLWTRWTAADGIRLQAMIAEAAGIWRGWLPEGGVNWFDVKLAELLRLPSAKATARCGFGAGEIAVAPSGHLYPCERLIGEDGPNNPMRLPGHVLDGKHFCDHVAPEFGACAACTRCSLQFACEAVCRCSNYVRTGDINHPDGLLCVLNKAVARAIAGALDGLPLNNFSDAKIKLPTRNCYAT